MDAAKIIRDSGPTAFMKEGLRYLFLRHGLETGRWAVRSKFDDIKTMSSSNSPTIVDGDAHRGQTIEAFLSIFDQPTIHSFEPNPEKAEYLNEKYADAGQVNIYGTALGPISSEVELNITEKDASSSIRPPTTKNTEAFGSRVSVVDTTMTQQVRADAVVGAQIDIIKLDVQGYELEALRGCDQFLEGVQIVLVESSFQELTRG